MPTLRHVRTLDSAGRTPIIVRDAPPQIRVEPHVNSRLASYLDSIDPSAHPDHTPFTEDISADENDRSSVPSSRKTSTSTVKALTAVTRNLGAAEQEKTADGMPRRFVLLEHVDEIEAREKLPTESEGKTDAVQDDEMNYAQDADLVNSHRQDIAMKGKANFFPLLHNPFKHNLPNPFWHHQNAIRSYHFFLGSPAAIIAKVETRESNTNEVGASGEPQKEEQHPRGRRDQYKPQVRPQSASGHSLRSVASSELRATAPEFFPRPQDGS